MGEYVSALGSRFPFRAQEDDRAPLRLSYRGAGQVGDGYDGVHIFNPDGERVAQVLLPEVCANVCFGGRLRNRLLMTASQSLYAVYMNVRGAHFC